jgi:hypothetical protein
MGTCLRFCTPLMSASCGTRRSALSTPSTGHPLGQAPCSKVRSQVRRTQRGDLTVRAAGDSIIAPGSSEAHLEGYCQRVSLSRQVRSATPSHGVERNYVRNLLPLGTPHFTSSEPSTRERENLGGSACPSRGVPIRAPLSGSKPRVPNPSRSTPAWPIPPLVHSARRAGPLALDIQTFCNYAVT